LSVAGNVLAEEVIVKPQSEWADHVFEPDYDLPTLEDVSSFIKEEGHLPNIPSAEAVEQNGLRLGEMDATLLQKVEELTLYAIEQKERADSLTALVQEQQRELEEQRKALDRVRDRLRRLERTLDDK
jgi:septal ring factor EnvC (AmiA/AmiB activator)